LNEPGRKAKYLLLLAATLILPFWVRAFRGTDQGCGAGAPELGILPGAGAQFKI